MSLHKLKPATPFKTGIPEDLKGPPEHLTESGKNLWRAVLATGSYDAPARALLGRFCEIRDQLEKVRGEIAALSSYVDSKGTIHPLIRFQKDLTNEYGKLFRLLGWDQA
jgi:hypothetical protein